MKIEFNNCYVYENEITHLITILEPLGNYYFTMHSFNPSRLSLHRNVRKIGKDKILNIDELEYYEYYVIMA